MGRLWITIPLERVLTEDHDVQDAAAAPNVCQLAIVHPEP